jgi:hypothetical protein
MDRLPEEKKLNIGKTFRSQQKLVHNNIIPVIQKSINKKIFPMTNGIIKYVVHERHRYQREELLNNQRSTSWKNIEKRKKHANSRRSDASINRFVCYCLINKYFLLFI